MTKVRIVAAGMFGFAGLVVAFFAMTARPEAVFAGRPSSPVSTSGQLVTLTSPLGENRQQLVVIEPELQSMCVYHIDSSGVVTLKSGATSTGTCKWNSTTAPVLYRARSVRRTIIRQRQRRVAIGHRSGGGLKAAATPLGGRGVLAMAQKFYASEEAAQKLGATLEQLNEMRDRRQIYAVRDGGAWKYKTEEVDRLIAERAEGMLPDSGDSGIGDLDDDPDSILLSDVELGPSSAGASSTVIGRSNAPSSPASDIQLASEHDSGELELPMGSDVKLDEPAVGSAPDSSGLSNKFDDLDTLDLDLPSASESGISLDSDVLAGRRRRSDVARRTDGPVRSFLGPRTGDRWPAPVADGGGSVLELEDSGDVLGGERARQRRDP